MWTALFTVLSTNYLNYWFLLFNLRLYFIPLNHIQFKKSPCFIYISSVGSKSLNICIVSLYLYLRMYLYISVFIRLELHQYVDDKHLRFSSRTSISSRKCFLISRITWRSNRKYPQNDHRKPRPKFNTVKPTFSISQ